MLIGSEQSMILMSLKEFAHLKEEYNTMMNFKNFTETMLILKFFKNAQTDLAMVKKFSNHFIHLKVNLSQV